MVISSMRLAYLTCVFSPTLRDDSTQRVRCLLGFGFYSVKMDKIPLLKGGVPIAWAIVDRDRHAELSEFRWHLLVTASGMRYAYRLERVPGNKKWCVFMHRHVLGLMRGDGKLVDHINRDSLDNRLANLRICTWAENNKNRTLPPHRYGSVCRNGHQKTSGVRCSICRAASQRAYKQRNLAVLSS